MLQLVDNKVELSAEVVQSIVEFERIAKEVKAKEDALKAAILKEMELWGILSIDTPELRISYVAPTSREVFDSKSFQKDFEELYDEYVTVTPVKPSIRVKVK